jgi:hypothetical protein
MTDKPIILAAGRIVNSHGDLNGVIAAEKKLLASGCRINSLHIDPLKKGWKTPLQNNHFRSGCGPVEALQNACESIRTGQHDAVVVEGIDHIRSDFAGKREKRQRLMNIYGDQWPLPKAYTYLAHKFIDFVGITPELFTKTAAKLYENYQRTAIKENIFSQPDAERFAYITDLFRAVDCANPSIDFTGRLLVGNKRAADICGLPAEKRVRVIGVSVEKLDGDGPAFAAAIAGYTHLDKAYGKACAAAGVNFGEKFLQGEALLEAYTCYPVVPMAFLLVSGIAEKFDDIARILDEHEVTVTGGMNLARAPWNNPALNALVRMYEKFRDGRVRIGLVHGNGGLGYKQGIAILGS